MLWLNITAEDDLIHKAHYGSLQMLIVRRAANEGRRSENVVNNSIWYLTCSILGMCWLVITQTQTSRTISRKQNLSVSCEQCCQNDKRQPSLHVRWIIIPGDLHNPSILADNSFVYTSRHSLILIYFIHLSRLCFTGQSLIVTRHLQNNHQVHLE